MHNNKRFIYLLKVTELKNREKFNTWIKSDQTNPGCGRKRAKKKKSYNNNNKK